VYGLDEIDEGAEVDVTMDLPEMALEYEKLIAPEELSVESSSESDDN